MDWLYIMISSRAAIEKYEFAPEAKGWVEERIKMSNEAKTKPQMHSRTRSVWWENSSGAEFLSQVNTDAKGDPKFLAGGSELGAEEREMEDAWTNPKGYKSLKIHVVSGNFSDVVDETKEAPEVFLIISIGLSEETTESV